MAEATKNPGEELGEMILEWAEGYWKKQAQNVDLEGDPDASRPIVLKAFTAGALMVFQHWEEVRPFVPVRSSAGRHLHTHHG